MLSSATSSERIISNSFKQPRVQIQDDFHPEVSEQDQLGHFGLLEDSHPTYGTLLSFGLNPTKWLSGAFTRCILWNSNDRHSGWLEAQDYRGGLLRQFEAGIAFIKKFLRLRRLIGREGRTEQWEIPTVALEEALANALVHREYMNQTSFVYVELFNDRIEISSPGGLPQPMTLENLEEEHKCHPRNPQVARLFYLKGLIEEVGSGIQRMQRAMEIAELLPAKFELGKDNTFKVIFYRPKQEAMTSNFDITLRDNAALRDRLNLIIQEIPHFWERSPYTHFTNHGPSHSERIHLQKLAQLAQELPDEQRLTDDEIFIVSAAAWLYEIGMQSTNLTPTLDFKYQPGMVLTFAQLQEIRDHKHQLAQRLIIDQARGEADNASLSLGLVRTSR